MKKKFRSGIIVLGIILAIVIVFAGVNYLYNLSINENNELGGMLKTVGIFSTAVSTTSGSPEEPPAATCEGVKCDSCHHCEVNSEANTASCVANDCGKESVCVESTSSPPGLPICHEEALSCCNGICYNPNKQICCSSKIVGSNGAISGQTCNKGESCCDAHDEKGKVNSIACYVDSSCAKCCEGIIYDPKESECCIDNDKYEASICARSMCPTCIKGKCVNECDWMPCYNCEAQYSFDSTGTTTKLSYGCMNTCNTAHQTCIWAQNPNGTSLPPDSRGPIDWDPNTKGPLVGDYCKNNNAAVGNYVCEVVGDVFRCCWKALGAEDVCQSESFPNIVTLKKCLPPPDID